MTTTQSILTFSSVYAKPIIIFPVTSHKHLNLHFINYNKERALKSIHIMRKLKFKLDRRSIEILYLFLDIEIYSRIRRCCLQFGKSWHDTIQREASTIVSGASTRVFLYEHKREVPWDSLYCIRRKHKLILLYKLTKWTYLMNYYHLLFRLL
jgi:hypothetical protein